MLDGYWLFSEPSSVEKGHQEIAGVLWGGSVALTSDIV